MIWEEIHVIDKTKTSRASKTIIAAVLASSGAVYTIPMDTANAAPTFSDVPVTNSHHDNIMKIYAKGVIKGYSDGTFRPNERVTRGQAAKMLANMLDLDTNPNSVPDPHFSDVSRHDDHYGPIAALVSEGIFGGYSDGTFKPYETLTRGQMAKILVRGYGFEVSSKLGTQFTDVQPNTSNAYYIQTLLDLKITQGTTPTTYSPYSALTRGQMATFLVRADDKSQVVSEYKVTGISGSTVYINGTPYSVAPSLKHIFNSRNAAVLEGAILEGKFQNKTISAVSKMTLNAVGKESRMLVFDGGNNKVSADIVINGNHILFRNADFTGTVAVNDNVRKSLGDTFTRVTRKALNIFTEDTSNERDNIFGPGNGGSGNGNINWGKPHSTMKDVDKNIQFENATIYRMVVSHDHTKIVSDTKIRFLEIIADVEQIELQADVGKIYVNTDTPLTIYGSGNIDEIQYDSYTDLQLYYDGHIGKLIVDNDFGWVDIGDETYIDEVIIPEGSGPNDIFDDFMEDKDNVTVIEDDSGKPIDKDDIENQKPADRTPPVVKITKAESVNGTVAEIDFDSDEIGTYYYIVRQKDEPAPTARELIQQKPNSGVANGSAAASVGKNTISVSGLMEREEYTVYLIVVDGSKNVSNPISKATFQMKDSTPPTVKIVYAKGLHGGQRGQFEFKASEPGDYYYLVREKTTAGAPTVEDIMLNPTGSGKTPDNLIVNEIIRDLKPVTEYELYIVMKDRSGNNSEKAETTTFITTELDNEPPYVTSGILEYLGGKDFKLKVNEELEIATAEDVNNYRVSGTGIVNIPGQKEVIPEKVVYKKVGKGAEITITVPAINALVNGDNIIVNVLPGVKDLADNDFENIENVVKGQTPRNKAEYKHDDSIKPVLTILGVEKDASQENAVVEFNTTKAGMYYYLIMPEGMDLAQLDIDGRDFVDEFMPGQESGKFQVKNAQGRVENIYVGTQDSIKNQKGTAIRDKQKFDVPIPKDLDPFKSYSIYMVVRDRSGFYTQIKEHQLIQDEKPPFIRDVQIKPQVGDKSIKLQLTSDEKGKYYYIYRKKDNPLTPGEEKAEFIRDNAMGSLSLKEGLNEADIRGLQPHEEYILYLAAEDTYGNITMQEAIGNGNDEPKGPRMKYPFYTDGTPPEFLNPNGEKPAANTNAVIQRQFGGKEFIVTFSESIYNDGMYNPDQPNDMPLDFFVVKDKDGKVLTPKATVEPIVDLSNPEKPVKLAERWEKRQMKLTFDEEIKAGFTVEVNAGTVDSKLGNNEFVNPVAEYKYPLVDKNDIRTVMLTGKVEYRGIEETEDEHGNPVKREVYVSDEMTITGQLKTDISWKQQFYYVTSQTSKNALTPEEVEKIIAEADKGKVTTDVVTEIITIGTDEFTTSNQSSFELKIQLPVDASGQTKASKFQTYQNLFFYTKDIYGNIVPGNAKVIDYSTAPKGDTTGDGK